MTISMNQLSARRSRRTRFHIAQGNKKERPRLSVFRSNRQIYAQIIDDTRGQTLLSVSSLEKTLREKSKSSSTKDKASAVGKLLAERAKKQGMVKVVFDRGRYNYHGRLEALAEAAREAGLEF